MSEQGRTSSLDFRHDVLHDLPAPKEVLTELHGLLKLEGALSVIPKRVALRLAANLRVRVDHDDW